MVRKRKRGEGEATATPASRTTNHVPPFSSDVPLPPGVDPPVDEGPEDVGAGPLDVGGGAGVGEEEERWTELGLGELN